MRAAIYLSFECESREDFDRITHKFDEIVPEATLYAAELHENFTAQACVEGAASAGMAMKRALFPNG